jgi:tetratricopeptide (TPR) repeat protein
VIEIDTGNIQEAIPLLKIALEENPANAQYWISSIDALIRLEATDDARRMLDQAKEKGAQGQEFAQLEERINKLDENVYDALSSKGSSEQMQLNNQDPLQEDLQPLINHYNQGQLHRALSEADLLLERFPNSVILHDICGASNSGLRQFPDAISNYKKALEINPYYADAYLNMGAAQKEEGDLEDAIESYKQVLKIKPDYAEAYSNIGVIMQDKRDLEAAIKNCKQAIRLKPRYADAYYNMGIALQAKGDLESALESYKHALSFEPDYALAQNNIGNVFLAQSNIVAAIEAYKQAIKINPDFA